MFEGLFEFGFWKMYTIWLCFGDICDILLYMICWIRFDGVFVDIIRVKGDNDKRKEMKITTKKS